MSRPPFATFDEIKARHPRELLIVAADEKTRELDRARVDAALIDVSTEIRAILAARYTPAELDRCDTDSLGVLKLFSIDMAMYRTALSNARSTEQIKERYDNAVKRLESIAKGNGGLTFEGGGSGSPDEDGEGGVISPNDVILVAPERVFTRRRLGSV